MTPSTTHRDPAPAAPDALGEARRLVNEWGYNATAYQILNPGIERWFSADRRAVVGYVSYGRHRVVAGSPICAPAALGEVIEAFEDDARRQRRFCCYFAADERLARRREARGPLDRILLGAQPVWDPAAWPSILEGKASLRAQLNRAGNKGVQVSRWPHERASGHPALKKCLREWLETRGLPPLHFLIEPDTLGRLYDRRVYVAERRGEAIGFVVASPVPQRNGWLIEQFVRGHSAPNGTTESMLDAAWRDLAAEGARWVTLGLSPLSSRACGVETPPQPAWLRLLLSWMRAHGRRFYNFDGLDAFKAKFLPQRWEPIYAITSERRVGPETLWAIAGAFATMSPVRLVITGLGRALVKEGEWLRQRLRAGTP